MTSKATSSFLLPAALGLIAACGGTVVTGSEGGAPTSSTSSSTSSSSGIATSSSSSGGLVDPPPPPPVGGMAGAGEVVMAVSKLYLGDTDRDGTPDKTNGWKQYGFDLDGKSSTAQSTDVCQPLNAGWPKNVYPDGPGGIDNNFGKLILPMFLGISSSFSSSVNGQITSGKGTILFDISALGPGSDQNPIGARMYRGADLGHPPLFDGSDVWPVNPASLASPTDITSALDQFPQSYLTANTWVGVPAGDITVNLAVMGVSLPLTIKHGVVTMNLDATHTGARMGTIAGVISVEALVASIKYVAGNFDSSLCASPTIDSIGSQVEQAADILQDGTQDPTKSCDAISIGLGFDAQVVQLGAIAPPDPPPPNPCQ